MGSIFRLHIIFSKLPMCWLLNPYGLALSTKRSGSVIITLVRPLSMRPWYVWAIKEKILSSFKLIN